MLVDPSEQFKGTVLIIAPHMDDEVLACGGTIARLPDKERIHVLYATDGMRSPSPVAFWRDSISSDLGEVRKHESVAATGLLGVPFENIHFLDLPEAELPRHIAALRRAVYEAIGRIKPDCVLVPFRYDRHPDHLAINDVVTAGLTNGVYAVRLFEYFVYYRWRLLRGGDVRQYVVPKCLFEVDVQAVSSLKRAALDCFRSQTTKYYSWQTRPILTPALLDEVSRTPEVFVAYESAGAGAAVFSRSVTWIRVVHRLEPFLQRWKYRTGALWRGGILTRDGDAS
jgi:LmbE family N-acetylglucosaminyl deacetylase